MHEINLNTFIIVLFIVVSYYIDKEIRTVQGHVCILTKRPDSAHGGVTKWSLPKKEICLCQGVVAPVVTSTCSAMEETFAKDDLWFIDDPRELTLRHNWRTDVLDTLLERTEYCGIYKLL